MKITIGVAYFIFACLTTTYMSIVFCFLFGPKKLGGMVETGLLIHFTEDKKKNNNNNIELDLTTI